MAHVATRVRSDGTKSYRVKWRDPDGALREKTFPTKKAALAHASSVAADKHRGTHHDDRLARLTFREVAEEWLPTRSRKARTTKEYERILADRIYPKFGRRQVGTIRVADCAAFMNALSGDGLRPATIRKVYGLFSTVLGYA